jgi:hypothetical protein
MKFRVFTNAVNGRKVAVNIDHVQRIETANEEIGSTYIFVCRNGGVVAVIEVKEDFDVVFSRLNTIAE